MHLVKNISVNPRILMDLNVNLRYRNEYYLVHVYNSVFTAVSQGSCSWWTGWSRSPDRRRLKFAGATTATLPPSCSSGTRVPPLSSSSELSSVDDTLKFIVYWHSKCWNGWVS